MQTIVNDIAFASDDASFVNHYNQHGWVVIRGVLPPDVLDETTTAWSEMKVEFATDMGMELTDYQLEVSQWRDLWMRGGIFQELIFGEHINPLVMESMGWNGTRLLHDHLIAKPRKGSNKKIPWHQDSMFWPVDLPGCSSWVALVDVDLEDGCLEVIDRSHLEGCEEPVDFMAKEREEFPADSVKVQLPIYAG